jgi:3-oxoacyl-[acyl-carrier protein] reductase
MSKTGRVVIVTGGGTGIGKAIVERFAENGDIVFALGRHEAALKQVASSLKGKEVHAVACDVTKPNDNEAAIKQVVDAHKHIDVLVNCAGAGSGLRNGMSLENAKKEWDRTIDVNLTGTFLMIYATKPHLNKAAGRIINISSIAALQGSSQDGGEAYAAAKSGIHGLVRTLVKELAPHGITVNSVAPGFIQNTQFFANDAGSADRVKSAAARIPAGRVGEPQEIASGVFFIASDEASYINGDILNINGGWQFGR